MSNDEIIEENVIITEEDKESQFEMEENDDEDKMENENNGYEGNDIQDIKTEEDERKNTAQDIRTDEDYIFKSDNIRTKEDETSNLNKIVIAIGYIFAVLIPLVGAIYGIILIYVKKPPAYREHGIYIVLVALIMWIIYSLISFAV